MIPKEFDYVAPSTLDEALTALQNGGENAKVLAGGHSLIPLMKLRLAEPSLLVDLRKVQGLQDFNDQNGQIEIGAMVTHNKLQTASWLQESCPLIPECASTIGDEQVRARGTIGGSLAHADPAADLTAAILALNGTIIAAKRDGDRVSKREIPAGDFFVDLLATALEPREILTAVRIPRIQGRTGSAYVKIRNKASHYALVGAAVVLQLGDDGKCSSASVALTGAASRPFRLEKVESALKGTKLNEDDIRNAAGKVSDADVDWLSDLF